MLNRMDGVARRGVCLLWWAGEGGSSHKLDEGYWLYVPVSQRANLIGSVGDDRQCSLCISRVIYPRYTHGRALSVVKRYIDVVFWRWATIDINHVT